MPENAHTSATLGGQNLENDREFKAHVYQQLVDLQPFLAPDSQVAVLVQQESDSEKPKKSEYTLTLVTTMGDYKLEAEGRDSDLYTALGIAKRKMLDQLEEWVNTSDSDERDAQIEAYLDGSHTIH